MAWAPSYVTALELWQYGQEPAATDLTGNPQAAKLTRAAAAASRAVDGHCSGAVRRQFGKAEAAAPVTRYYTTYYNDERGAYCVEMDDLASGTGLVVTADGVAVEATDCVLLPRNAATDGFPYTHLALPVRAREVALTTDQWGWATTPEVATQATLMQGWRIFMRSVAWAGVAGSPDQGSEVRLLSRLDPDVAVLLKDYRRTGGVL